jgi:hypothetical protein
MVDSEKLKDMPKVSLREKLKVEGKNEKVELQNRRTAELF